jgi:exonuclease III
LHLQDGEALKKLVALEQLDAVCLQETKLQVRCSGCAAASMRMCCVSTSHHVCWHAACLQQT